MRESPSRSFGSPLNATAAVAAVAAAAAFRSNAPRGFGPLIFPSRCSRAARRGTAQLLPSHKTPSAVPPPELQLINIPKLETLRQPVAFTWF